MPQPDNLLQIIKRQRGQIEKVDAQNIKQITQVYLNMYDNLRGDVDALRLAIEAIENPSVAEIKRLAQYKRLLSHSDQELKRFNIYLETQIEAIGKQSVTAGLNHSAELMRAYLQGHFGGLKTNAVAPLLDYLRRDGPLFERLAKITYATSAGVTDAIIKGVGLGYNPRKIASAIQDAFGGGLTDALRNTRTVQLYSYRDSARANYMASGVVNGWVWMAELDGEQCEACTAEHGGIHDLDETLNGHYNCRCSPLPYIEQFGNPIEQSGEDWFNSLSEKEQADFLGQSKYEALKDGKFEFSQLATEKNNDVYGNMKAVASLAELIGEE